MDINIFRVLALFRNINEDDIERLISQVRIRKKIYEKRQLIHHQGLEYSSLYIVSRGYCQGEMSRSAGKVLKVEEFHAPDAIAPGILFSPRNNLPVSLVAANDVEIYSIPKEDIFAYWFKNETFLKNYMEDISDKIFLLSSRLEILSFSTVKGKIARYFLSQDKNEFLLKTSLDELAQYLAVTRPSLSRSLSELVESGLITKQKKLITILDQNALEELLY